MWNKFIYWAISKSKIRANRIRNTKWLKVADKLRGWIV